MSSPLPPDPYEALGVSKDAQIPEIRSAHRKLVLKCHPDKVQDPALKAAKQDEFQRVQQAYEILSDETEREKYDTQVRLLELRRQHAQQKANSSATRSSRNAPEYEVHYASPRPSHRSSPSTAAPPTFTKVYYSNKAWDSDENRRSVPREDPRVYDAEPRGPPRRESSFATDRASRPSKREVEREREREKDRDRERDRERRKRADKEARLEKEAKEAKRAEKKAREKMLSKEYKREAEAKQRYMTPDEDVPPPPRMEKKSSSTRKHEPRESSVDRERNFAYDEAEAKARYAENYINAARVNAGGEPRRAKTYHGRTPYVPSPPPAPGVASAYPSPDEDEPRRSSASASARRRGSADMPKPSREKAYSKLSRESLDEEPIIHDVRPSFHKSASSTAAPPRMSNSPPRPLPRTNTMPAESSFVRPVPGITRAKTFTDGAVPRGRMRSKMEAQAEVDSEDEDVWEQERERERRARDREARDARDGRDRKHRSSRKARSPERYREEPRTQTSYTYSLAGDGGPTRTKLARTYTRQLDEEDLYDQFGARHVERPPLGARESSYSSGYGAPSPMSKFPRVKTTKLDDVQYSKYPAAYAV